MEKAIHITKPANFKYHNSRYSRIYFGVEFCQNLIPTVKDLEKALNFAVEKNLQLTLVTPFVTENGLCRLNRLFRFLKPRLKNCEIVVNDWGILEILSKRYKTFNPLLGRLLVRQNRDPAIMRILKKHPASGTVDKYGKVRIIAHIPPGGLYQEGIRGSYVSMSSVQRFLSKFNIGRIELNNLMQGLDLPRARFKLSLYTPFVNIATTRFCPMETRFQKIHRINVCKRECQKYYSRLINRNIPKVIYKRGNTTFYKNPVNLGAVDKSLIDRIVFQPELPF